MPAADIAAIIVKMASENSWGYTRIKGALKKLGHKADGDPGKQLAGAEALTRVASVRRVARRMSRPLRFVPEHSLVEPTA
jgi:hypothetical protein